MTNRSYQTKTKKNIYIYPLAFTHIPEDFNGYVAEKKIETVVLLNKTNTVKLLVC